ncbi:MAG: hypothetical protein V3U72_04735 [Candidatus Aenigmarchaeota archaeon]
MPRRRDVRNLKNYALSLQREGCSVKKVNKLLYWAEKGGESIYITLDREGNPMSAIDPKYARLI